MVTDAQVRKLFRDMNSEKFLAVAARKAGMDEKTARKYRSSDLKQPRTYRTRPDPLAQLWPKAQVLMLRVSGRGAAIGVWPWAPARGKPGENERKPRSGDGKTAPRSVAAPRL